MPKPSVMRLQYNGQWYEIEQIAGGELHLPEDVKISKLTKISKLRHLLQIQLLHQDILP